MDGLSSIAGLRAARLSVLQDLPEALASAVLCTQRAVRPVARRKVQGPALANAPAWVPAPVSDSVPGPVELPALFRLRVKHHGRSARATVRGVAGRLTRRPRKAQ